MAPLKNQNVFLKQTIGLTFYINKIYNNNVEEEKQMNINGLKSYGEFTKEELAKMPHCPYVDTRGEEACKEDEFIVWLEEYNKWAYDVE